MRIEYPNGKTSHAALLLHEEHRVRAAMQIGDDVVEFTEVNGTWFTEDGTPVLLAFEWQSRTLPVPVESDCICPAELASRLLHLLYAGGDGQERPARPAGAAHKHQVLFLRAC